MQACDKRVRKRCSAKDDTAHHYTHNFIRRLYGTERVATICNTDGYAYVNVSGSYMTI